MTLLSCIKQLTPRQFENLIYDLLVRRNLANVRWRTPGSDGGRDIEGDLTIQDFSGTARVEHWYVECKRYKRAIDWPTVSEKLAYACNHGADFLLFCTTSSLSPQCKDEVSRHEARNSRPRIRAWEGPELENLISNDPVLKIKYGLSKTLPDRQLSTLPLLVLVTKIMHQIHGEASITTQPTPSIEFAAAASEFSTWWAQTPHETWLKSGYSTVIDRDLYPWCKVLSDTGISRWDPYPLRALLSGMRFATKADTIEIMFSSTVDQTPMITVSPAPDLRSSVAGNILNSLSLLANWEWKIDGTSLVVTQRISEELAR